jgi:glucose/arabinose dehydrogenase/PKD repeat protein
MRPLAVGAALLPLRFGGPAIPTPPPRLLALVALLSLTLAQTVDAAPAGLVAAYGFDEATGTTAVDVSGLGNTGVLNSTTTRTTSGKYGGALVFDGSSAFVSISDAASLDLTSAMTLEAWVYPTRSGAGWGDVVYKANDAYYLDGSSTNSGFPAAGGTFTASPLYSTAALPQNTWSHLAATYDGTTLRLYVNGTQVASKAQTGAIQTSSLPLTIGGDVPNGQNYTGRIDEVRVYNRALSVAEIQSDRDIPVNSFGTQPPTVSISYPIAGAGPIGGVVAVSASLSSTVGVGNVEFFVDGVSLGIDGTAPYLVGWNSNTATNGPHTLTAVAHDAAGNSVTSPPVVASTTNPAFTNEVVVPGITAADTMIFLPDGRMLVGELTGKVWVVQPGASVKDPTPFLTVDYSLLTGEQGLMDITLDPAFASNGYYYVFYTHGSTSGNRDRVSRFTASGGGTVAGSEFLLWQDDVDAATEHHGGVVAFGPDGKLYVTVGDHFNAVTSPDLTSYHGKILRINSDGSIPSGNPFADGSGPHKDEIWAYGLRNPFRGAFDPVSGRLYIGDVGGNDPSVSMEEVNVGAAGANYGWPLCEGQCGVAGTTNPLYAYPHAGRDACVTGGFVYRGTQFPAEYYGSYFFGDYVQNTIKRAVLDPTGNLVAVLNFEPADGTPDGPMGDPVKIIQGPDGSLYYVDIGFNDSHVPNAAAIRRIRYTISNQPPVAVANATPTSGPPQLVVSFSSAGSFDPEGHPITYSWAFGDGATSTQPNPTHTYVNAGPYTARLSVSDGVSSTLSSDLKISVGNAPVPTILSPADGLVFQAGDVVSYSGSGTDVEDGALAAGAFSWTILFHHDNHVHPGAGPIANTKTGTFAIPTSGHDFSGTTSYEIILTVTDSNGLSGSTSVFIYPNKVNVNLDANPSGLGLDIDGIRVVTPHVKDTVPNFQHVLNAPTQILGSTNYAFSSWSDGGAATHTIVVAQGGASYLATFAAAGGTGLVAAYGFEEGSGSSALDYSTFGNTGTLAGGTTRTTSGKFGNALVFNGTDALVTIPDSASLDLTDAMTLEAWVFPTLAGANWRDVIYKVNDIYFLEGSSPGTGVPAVGATFSGPPLVGPSALPANTWSHLAATYDGAALILYVNGAPVASRPQTGSVLTSNGELSIGGDSVFGQYFGGRIDEVRIYNRALAASEIQLDMSHSIDPAYFDTDGDGVLDATDNCRFIANATQTNSDAFAAGDACQCGDVDASGGANAADVTLLRNALAALPPGLSGPGSLRCPVIAPAATCDIADLSVLRRALAAKPPGIAQVCPAQFAP